MKKKKQAKLKSSPPKKWGTLKKKTLHKNHPTSFHTVQVFAYIPIEAPPSSGDEIYTLD